MLRTGSVRSGLISPVCVCARARAGALVMTVSECAMLHGVEILSCTDQLSVKHKRDLLNQLINQIIRHPVVMCGRISLSYCLLGDSC